MHLIGQTLSSDKLQSNTNQPKVNNWSTLFQKLLMLSEVVRGDFPSCFSWLTFGSSC